MTFGLKLKSSFATLASVAVQPKPIAPSATVVGASLSKSKVLPESMFSKVIESKATRFIFPRFDFPLIKDFLNIRVDSRYSDELPRSTTKFTPFEELSGISSTRPEILSVSEFKPVYTNNGFGLTAAGAFMDAQVKLMNLRHEAVASLVNDLKKDPELAEQLDQIEGDFVLHVQNLKSRADFLVTLQKYIERITKTLDLRDSAAVVDAASVVAYYFSSIFTNVNTAQASLPTYTFSDLLSQHGFSKAKVTDFSSSKVFVQTLYEARKILRAGSDELVSVDPSLASRDSDAVTLNKRTYRDPHVDLERVRVPTYATVASRAIHTSDSRLNTLLQELETHYRSLDKVFSYITSEEVGYALKIRTVTREALYSHALSNSATTALLSDYGYPVSSELGNQQLFDAVYGQLGSRVTDNRTGTNANAMASIASRVDGDRAILTYEVDYLEDDQGSVYSPGASYYIAGTLRPNGNAAFSIERPSELVTRMTTVVDKYVDFIGRFNLLPKVGNVITNQLGNVQHAMDAVSMTNALYSLFIDDASGRLKNDCIGNPVVDLFGEAATHAALRANLLMYFSCVTNASNDGLADAAAARSLAGQDLRQEAQNRAADAERQNERVSPTIDKLIKNCVTYYKQITGDTAGATKVENSLRNFNEQGPLSRAVAFVKSCNDIHKSTMNGGYTRYSHLSDMHMVAQVVQLTLDTARRYAYNRVRVNKATLINSNAYAAATSVSLAVRAAQSVQLMTPQVATRTLGKKTSLAAGAFTAAASSSSLVVSYLVSKLPLKQAIVARLEREDNLMIRTVLAPLHAVRLVKDNVKDFVLYLQRAENVKVLNDILNVVGDRKLVELLADKGQVRLLYDTVETVASKIIKTNNANVTDITDVTSLTRTGRADDDLRVFDDSFITSKTANLIKAVYANAKYSPDRGANMRVISFGLPHGFTSRLHNKFKLSAFAEQVRSRPQQNDVVVVDVYKVDVRYPDIVFKPIPKLFELSRFVVRDESKYRPVQVGSRIEEVLDAVPTRDYSDLSSPTTSYGGQLNNGYGFMTKQDFEVMHRNTVMSYLHEVYFRLITGIPMSERELYIADPDETDRPAPFVVKALLQNTTEKVFRLPTTSNLKLNFSLVSAAKTVSYAMATQAPKSATRTLGKRLKQNVSVSYVSKAITAAKSYAEAATHLAKKKTVYTDRDLAAKYMMSPKLFERVFFIDVDPDDFQIDREETFKSEVGRSTFAQLQQAGEIEVETETVGSNVREAFYLKDYLSEKQMTFEKYFVVVRAYSPLTTRTR